MAFRADGQTAPKTDNGNCYIFSFSFLLYHIRNSFVLEFMLNFEPWFATTLDAVMP